MIHNGKPGVRSSDLSILVWCRLATGNLYGPVYDGPGDVEGRRSYLCDTPHLLSLISSLGSQRQEENTRHP